ncbi:hypothetical protein CIB48_g1514 [Xylaria polymorpha]|nr:hypothetical protein CIB48_g1514 [Xylaria polymorpha]
MRPNRSGVLIKLSTPDPVRLFGLIGLGSDSTQKLKFTTMPDWKDVRIAIILDDIKGATKVLTRPSPSERSTNFMLRITLQLVAKPRFALSTDLTFVSLYPWHAGQGLRHHGSQNNNATVWSNRSALGYMGPKQNLTPRKHERRSNNEIAMEERLSVSPSGLTKQGVFLLTLAAGIEAVRTIIPTTSFNSQSDFDTDWNYNYPWGTDHNGGARMSKDQVKFSNGMLTLTAKKVTGQPDAVHGGKNIKINYLAGAIHAKEHFNVSRGGGYDFSGEFKATTTKVLGRLSGLRPSTDGLRRSIWPNGRVLERSLFIGRGALHTLAVLIFLKSTLRQLLTSNWQSFNTFNTSSILSWKDVTYSSPDQFHSIKCEVRDINQKDVSVKFYMDGSLIATQIGGGYFGKPLYLIINLQMEGSSGSPGPSSVRNLEALSYNP